MASVSLSFSTALNAEVLDAPSPPPPPPPPAGFGLP
eukprot:CAMPEP_0198681728 /NCGR_PEP_ID=MMETSP1468-20131203/7398_1 /TAXON_ID=1461545 /ORGANISM="Mantoniella sp, Strain CCMP1436" /LENGTH=35 /DNA_ID= /DNA_START= /DNA_END= /DNA_ORIENTATION=